MKPTLHFLFKEARFTRLKYFILHNVQAIWVYFFLQTRLSYHLVIWSFSNLNNFPYSLFPLPFILQFCPKIDLTLFLFYPFNTFFHVFLGPFLSLPPTFADTSFGTVNFQFGVYAYTCMCMCLCMCVCVCAYFDYLCILFSIETLFEAQLPTFCGFFLDWIWLYWEVVIFSVQNECATELEFVGYFLLNIQQAKIWWAKAKEDIKREGDCEKLLKIPLTPSMAWKCCHWKTINNN